MSQKQKIVHSFFWKLLERFGSQAISMFVTILLARILLPSEYGIIAILVVFIDLANVIIDGGLNTALIQKRNADNVDFSTILYVSIGLALIIYILLFLGAPWIAQFYDNSLLSPVLRVLGINLFFNSFNAIQRAYISKYMLFKKLFYCTLGSTLLSGVVGLAMAYQGYGVWSLVGQLVVNQFATTLIMWFTIKWRPIPVFSFLRFKRLFDFGWKIFLANLIIVVYEDVRSLIIGKVYQPVTLAFFDRGKQLPGLMMTNVNISLQTILLPAFANIQDDPQRVKQMTKRSIELTNFVIMPLLVGLLVAAKPFVLLLLTEKWLGVVPFIQIFCIAYMMIPIQSSNMSAIKALGHSGITLKIEIIKKVIEAVILVVSFLIDVYAVAWGIVLYNFICIIVNLYPCRKLLDYGLFEQLKDVISPIFSSVAMGLAIFWISDLDYHPALLLAMEIVLGILIYVSIHVVLKTNCYLYAKEIIVYEIGKRKSINKKKSV